MLTSSIDNAVKKVRCWWRTPSPLFPPPSFRREQCNVPVWFPEDDITDDSDSTVPPGERTNRVMIEHGVDTGNFDMLIVPVTSVGFVGVFDVNGDGISLISRAMDQSGAVVESSATARLFIRVNSERSLGMPFSFLNDPFGAQKCDLLSLAARVQRVWIYCVQASQDPLNFPSIVIVFTKGIGISGLFGSAGFATGTPASPATSGAGGGSPGGAPGGGGSPGGGIQQGGGGGRQGGGGGRPNQL